MKNKRISLKDIAAILLSTIAFGLTGYLVASIFTENSIILFFAALLTSFIPEKTFLKPTYGKYKAASAKMREERKKNG